MPDVSVDRSIRNLTRAENLIAIFKERTGEGAGRASVADTDLLRSAVVFLHATVEELLRFVLRARWAQAGEAGLYARVPFPLGEQRPEKISLDELARHFGGKSVDEVLQESVEAHLKSSSFSRVSHVVAALRRARLESGFLREHASGLQTMMRRRHQIVHFVDNEEETGSGFHDAHSLSLSLVRDWKNRVESVCAAIAAQLQEENEA